MAGVLIPIFGVVFGCGIALLAIWTEYKRDRALVEKGLYQPEKPEPAGRPGRGFLATGSMLGAIGIALVASTFVFLVGKATGIPGFIFPFIGVASLIIYSVAQKKEMTARD